MNRRSSLVRQDRLRRQNGFDLQLERFADATYSMRLIAEGFEAEGGRSVTGTVDALVSALPYVIGCKPDGDLRYIEMDKPRAVDLRRRSAAQPHRAGKRDCERDRAGTGVRSDQAGERQLCLRIGFERARREIGKDFRLCKRPSLHAPLRTSQAITCSSCATIRTGV
jgi:Large extracellular alpha-helical protein